MQVEVVRSARRRKTVQARIVNGVLRVHIPARMSRPEEARWVAEMQRRIERQTTVKEIDLTQRARSLAAAHRLEVPDSIRWVDNQETRWGSCTPARRSIRISSRLLREPRWVLDYVIVHELAHLTEPRHGRRFKDLEARYPLAERARGFLMARSSDPGEDPWPDDELLPGSDPGSVTAV